MRGALLYGPGDARVEDREIPVIVEPTDAILKVTAACICGSDLWPYRGEDATTEPTPIGHEYVGVVEQVGTDVRTIKVGDFVVGSFFASDNTDVYKRQIWDGAGLRVAIGSIQTSPVNHSCGPLPVAGLGSTFIRFLSWKRGGRPEPRQGRRGTTRKQAALAGSLTMGAK